MNYPIEQLDEDEDDGTIVENVQRLTDVVVGRRIVSTGYIEEPKSWGCGTEKVFALTLDNGMRVKLFNTDDCCAYTELESFLLHPELVDHVITGVGTTNEYTRWHIYADMGDVLELEVGWNCGNPFYYGYGFGIDVEPLESA